MVIMRTFLSGCAHYNCSLQNLPHMFLIQLMEAINLKLSKPTREKNCSVNVGHTLKVGRNISLGMETILDMD
jgi:hypothetical protein